MSIGTCMDTVLITLVLLVMDRFSSVWFFQNFPGPEPNLRFGSAFWPNLEPNLRFRFSQVQFRFTVIQTLNQTKQPQSVLIQSFHHPKKKFNNHMLNF